MPISVKCRTAINIVDVVYPDSITKTISGLKHFSADEGPGTVGKDVNFACGSFVRFYVDIEDGAVTSVTFSSNGCGYMMAAADMLADHVAGRELTELQGLAEGRLHEYVDGRIDKAPVGRNDCIDSCINALRGAFAHFRNSQIEEFRGEKALICTCFGVTEETIERVLQNAAVETVVDVTRLCRAGGGCGSCTMMIQEMLDNRHL